MANKFRDRLIQQGISTGARIVLPEVDDPRVVDAKRELLQIGFNIVEMADSRESISDLKDSISTLKFTKNWTKEQLHVFLENPLNMGMAMVANGLADGLVAGAINSTSDVIRAAIRMVGVKPSSKWVSSIFFMVSPDGEKAFTYSDCGVIPEPTSEQLVAIAKDASEFHELLSGDLPKVAFLSFSTKGSADHYRVKRVTDATRIFSIKYGHIAHDGELQFDAAVDQMVASKKAPESSLQGNANVMVFPNLDAGNIAYKITERLAGYSAWGPLLQGLNKPVHDLSRGCSVDDIILVAAIAALQKDVYANV
ncbi:MAG: phosphate acetyltransferase [Candidatus Marinimicrobia bacterium]|nr:phosphate acetyltransferase [Candidatus Neomarinimicrobiota bacterium]